MANGEYGYGQSPYPAYEAAEDIDGILEDVDDWNEGVRPSDFDEPLLSEPSYPRDRTFSARRIAKAFSTTERRMEQLEAQITALARRDRRIIDRLREQVDEASNDALMGALLNQVSQKTETITDDEGNEVEILVPPTGINRIVSLLPALTDSSAAGSRGRNNMLPLILLLATENGDEDSDDQNKDLLPVVLALTMMNR